MKKSNIKSKIKKDELNPLFRFRDKEEDEKVLTEDVIKAALNSGRLELTSKNLSCVPEEIWNLSSREEEKTNPNVVNMQSKLNKYSWWNRLTINYLDLSSNVLVEISSDISSLVDLTVLNLQDNALITLPKEIGLLKKLTRLNLSHNRINHLPNEIFSLHELKYLNLLENELEDLPNELELFMLEFLDISKNKLNRLPEGIGFLTHLIHLSINHNKLKKIPADITNLRNLQKLEMIQNQIKCLPDNMADLRKIEFIYAQHNNIGIFRIQPCVELFDQELVILEKLPCFCEKLIELHVSNNNIIEIPSKFCENLASLKLLDLRDNKIKKLPDEISSLQSLVRLDLSNNSIESLPTSLCKLTQLVTLKIEGNPIKSIRRDIIACGTRRILKTLNERRGVELKNLEQTSATVPHGEFPDVYQLKKSKALSLAGRNLVDIPEQLFIIAREAEVTVVDASKNNLKQIPIGLNLLNSISELNLKSNLLMEINFTAQFSNIQCINLSCNHLESLPDSVRLMTSMREINISFNRFVKLPTCIYDLINLEILIACNNKIETIDTHGLEGLKQLATLDLSNNSLAAISPELGNMIQLTTLMLHGNCFRNPRPQIIESGTATILSYLRDRIQKSTA